MVIEQTVHLSWLVLLSGCTFIYVSYYFPPLNLPILCKKKHGKEGKKAVRGVVPNPVVQNTDEKSIQKNIMGCNSFCAL